MKKAPKENKVEVYCYGGPYAGKRLQQHSAGTLTFTLKNHNGRYVRVSDTSQKWEADGAN